MKRFEMGKVDELLKGLKGVVNVKRVSDECRRDIEEIEARFERTAFLPISNLGIRSVLSRKEVWVILKDRQFRPPPRPTVYLVEELPDEDIPTDHVLTVEGGNYRILGEEVLPGSGRLPENARQIGDGFVFFPQRRSSPKIPSYFMIPPIEFPELDDAGAQLDITRVVSVSPSTLADQFIRTTFGFPSDASYATILIGFDRI
jgi:hypothetical protein